MDGCCKGCRHWQSPFMEMEDRGVCRMLAFDLREDVDDRPAAVWASMGRDGFAFVVTHPDFACAMFAARDTEAAKV